MAFELDYRLAGDSVLLKHLDLCQLRLMNDSRWPWLILVPMRENVSELFELSPGDQLLLSQEAGSVGEKLKKFTGCVKINVAAIGNIVRQLHVHIIARNEGDANWPGPVWGHGQRVPYNESELQQLSEKLADVY